MARYKYILVAFLLSAQSGLAAGSTTEEQMRAFQQNEGKLAFEVDQYLESKIKAEEDRAEIKGDEDTLASMIQRSASEKSIAYLKRSLFFRTQEMKKADAELNAKADRIETALKNLDAQGGDKTAVTMLRGIMANKNLNEIRYLHNNYNVLYQIINAVHFGQ